MWSNVDMNCSLTINTCSVSQTELAERDSMAILRSVLSSLSIIGTISIIISVIRGRQACSPKIHPIFMLSIADFILAALWIAGGGIWLSADPYHFRFSRKNCFVILLATVVMECVTINLTCIYALLAYSSIKQRDFSNVYSLLEKDANSQVWRPWKIVLIYVAAWLLPFVIILVSFAAVDRKFGIVQNTDDCTCWCVPYFGNLKPHTTDNSQARTHYLYSLGVFVLIYSVVVAIHYIIGFLLLAFIYMAILARIRRMRVMHKDMTKNSNLFGATETILMKGQSQAKARVVYFLTVFVICSFFNLFLAIILVHYSTFVVNKYRTDQAVLPKHHSYSGHGIPTYAMLAYVFQSITVPLQGFLNAIVYGWTRKDFVQAVDFHVKTHSESTPIIPPKQRRKLLFGRNSQEKQQLQQQKHQHGQRQDQDDESSYEQDTRNLLTSPKDLIEDEVS